MAACEDICWEALAKAHGQSVSADWLPELRDGESIRNAIPIKVLEGNLVLHHKRVDVVDSLQFLEKRGYLVLHGSRDIARSAYSLSDTAISALEMGSFPERERAALDDQS